MTSVTPILEDVTFNLGTAMRDRVPDRSRNMSYVQPQIWFLGIHLENQMTQYCTVYFGLKRPLSIDRLVSIFTRLEGRYGIRRTSIFIGAIAEEALRKIQASLRLCPRIINHAGEAEIRQLPAPFYELVYGLRRDESATVSPFSKAPDWCTITFGYSCILLPHTRFPVYILELESLHCRNIPRPLNNRYLGDFVEHRRRTKERTMKTDLSFWESELSRFPPIPPPLVFSQVRNRKALKSHSTHNISKKLDQSLSSRINLVCSKNKVSTLDLHISILQIVLLRMLDEANLCIGLGVPYKSDINSKESVTIQSLLPIRFQPKSYWSFSDTLRRTRTKVLSILAHSRFPLHVLMRKNKSIRLSKQTSLFRLTVSHGEDVYGPSTFDDRQVKALAVQDAVDDFDLRIEIIERPDGSNVFSVTMADCLYSHDDTDMLMRNYVNILQAVLENPSVLLGECPVFSHVETEHGLQIGRGPRVNLNRPETIAHRIDKIAMALPGAEAIKESSGNSLTYSQMSKRADEVAAAMLEAGVASASLVAVFCEPSADVICTLLAIMRVGAVYIPLDLRNPVTRLASIIDDCQPTLIICHDPTVLNVDELKSQAKTMNISALNTTKEVNVKNRSDADSHAFVLYTSGSTGRPKGVLLKHYNFANQIAAVQRTFGFGKETVLQQSSLGFDVSLYQICLALTSGGLIAVANKDIRGEPTKLADFMLREKITLTVGVPSEYAVLLRYGSECLTQCTFWRFAICGGESMTTSLKRQFKSLGLSDLVLLNCYGPTEVSLASSFGRVPYAHISDSPADEEIPIGPSLPNYSVYILDNNMQPVPNNFPGEVYIGGAGVAAGYLNNDSLSKSRFITNKFASAEDTRNGWDRMYRTGDKGKLRSDGSLVFLGRIDPGSQVKLRGIRIELADVANSILGAAHGVLDEAAVSVRGNPDQILIAFVVFSIKSTPCNPEQYLEDLRRSLPLPSYMCPAALFPLDRLPVTVNGKIDRRAVDAISPALLGSPTSNKEMSVCEVQLKRIWETVLSNTPIHLEINRDSDFFQLGGTSLLLVKLQALIREAFQLFIPLPELFQASPMRDMAARVSTNRKDCLLFQNIEWDKEIADLVKHIHRSESPIKRRLCKKRKVFLLTGSTGFLGQAILRNLVADCRVATIHCVGIRSDIHSVSDRLRVDPNKIKLYPGDLSLPQLGLSSSDAAKLSREVDVIIHNGADVSFLKTYQTLRKANVESTIELAKLAVPLSIPIHYVSSGGIARLTGYDILDTVSVASHQPPADGSDGYIASKWASERCLEIISERLNLPVWIHRPTTIVGEGVPSTDVMHNLFKFSCLMQAVPALDDWQGVFDLISVNAVAEGILNEALGEDGEFLDDETRRSTTYVHHCGETRIPVSDLKIFLEGKEGVPFKVVALQEWVLTAGELGLDHMVAAFFESSCGGRGAGLVMATTLKK